MNVMQWGGILLLLAGLGGLTMAWMRISGKPQPPGWLAAVHGVAAVPGLVLVAWAALVTEGGDAVFHNIALILAVLAAAGGLTLLIGYHMKGLPLPIIIVVLHGILGAAAIVFTLLAGFADMPLGAAS